MKSVSGSGVEGPQNLLTPRTDHDLDHLFPFHDLDLVKGDRFPILYDLYDLYDLAHVAGWEPHNLHAL